MVYSDDSELLLLEIATTSEHDNDHWFCRGVLKTDAHQPAIRDMKTAGDRICKAKRRAIRQLSSTARSAICIRESACYRARLCQRRTHRVASKSMSWPKLT
jgi:hypothetical protein